MIPANVDFLFTAGHQKPPPVPAPAPKKAAPKVAPPPPPPSAQNKKLSLPDKEIKSLISKFCIPFLPHVMQSNRIVLCKRYLFLQYTLV